MATLRINDFPDPLYEQLKAQAKKNRRAISAEVIHLLKASLSRSRRYTVNDFKSLAGPWKNIDVQKWIDRERNGW